SSRMSKNESAQDKKQIHKLTAWPQNRPVMHIALRMKVKSGNEQRADPASAIRDHKPGSALRSQGGARAGARGLSGEPRTTVSACPTGPCPAKAPRRHGWARILDATE